MNTKRIFTFLLIINLVLSLGPVSQWAQAAPASAAIPAAEHQALTKEYHKHQEQILPEGVSADWWAQAQEYIRASEYHINWQAPTYLPDLGAAYQAPNRAQGLRAYFTPQGIRLMARSESAPSWQIGLALVRAGYPATLSPVQPAALSTETNRVDYERATLGEWYLNTAEGLQQGFELQPEAPNNADTTEAYILELALDGDLTATLVGDEVELRAPDGQLVLRYGDLKAIDTAGQALPVELALHSEPVSGDAYLHLTLPVFSQPVSLTAWLRSPLGAEASPAGLPPTHDWTYTGDQSNEMVGFSVGTAGDVNGDGYSDVIVGVFGYEGVGGAFVWYGSVEGLGASRREPDWIAVGGQNSFFGWSVSTAGDVDGDGYSDIIIGAPGFENGESNEGGAFVWYGSANGLDCAGDPQCIVNLVNADWAAESNQASANFGHSVGTAGDVDGDGYSDILVGAPAYDNPAAVYAWYGSSTGLGAAGTPQNASWKYESNQVFDVLGYSAGTAGDLNGDGCSDIVVGAPYFDSYAGYVYVWYGVEEDGLGASQREPDWARTGEPDSSFGNSVSMAGDVDGDGYSDIVVGAPAFENGQTDEGAVYVFYGGGNGIEDSAGWKYESNQANIYLGHAVSAAGDLNGDGYADILAAADLTLGGIVYIWYGSQLGMGVPQRNPDWKYEDFGFTIVGHLVGTAGDVDGDGYSDILIGSPYTDQGGASNAGQVYLYYGSPGNPLTYAGGSNPSPQGGAEFGKSVGTAGDVNGDGYSDVIVGAWLYDDGHTNAGRVYVWYGSAAGLSISQRDPDWWIESNKAEARFGYSVGTAGDVNGDGYDDIIVGTPHFDNGQTDEGAVFVWYGSAAGLGPNGTPDNADWTVESDHTNYLFGSSVGTAGDVDGDGYDDVLVGAMYYSAQQTEAGAVFVWKGADNGLCPGTTPCSLDLGSAAWRYENNQPSARLGTWVGTAGDVNGDGYNDIVVSAPYHNTDTGYVYIWHGAADIGLGDPQRPPDWERVGEPNGGNFGYPVSTAGDVDGDGYSDIVVGAPYYTNGQADEGAIYVFYGGEDGIEDSGEWKYESDQADTRLGYRVSTTGDLNGDGYADILAGAPSYDSVLQDEGAVYIWYGSESGMGDPQRYPDWKYEGDQTSGMFGRAVGTAGDVDGDGFSDILIGTTHFDYIQHVNAGYVFVYHGSEQGLSGSIQDGVEGEMRGDLLGFSVGGAGDINGDGYSDVIVGAPYFDNGQASEGRAYVFKGSPTGILTNTRWYAESNQANANLGSTVGSAGDVNGDGYSDIIVGAPYYDEGQVDEGAAFVWHGSATGLGSNGDPTTANWVAQGDQALAFLGQAVSTAGDVDGDGYGDVIVGAPNYDNGQDNEGQARVYHGSPTGLSPSPAWSAESNQDSASLGKSVGGAGDVDGDGYSDVIVGAPNYNDGQTDEGHVFVYHGSAAGLASTPNWIAASNQANAYFGYAVGNAGDLNGDGYSDVVIGAYQYDHGTTWQDDNEGAVFVWYGSAAGLGTDGDPNNAGWMAEGHQKAAEFGYSVSSAGDVNGDSYSDIVVGAPSYNNGPPYEGRVFVYFGSREGVSMTARWMAEGDQVGAAFGTSAAGAGDINGDGFADLIVGAPNYDRKGVITDEDVGLARVYYGNGKSILTYRPRQMRVAASDPIAPLGLSDSETSVKLHLNGHSPLGCSRVKMEWQIAPLGTLFTDPSVIEGSSENWIDTCLEGEEITELVLYQ